MRLLAPPPKMNPTPLAIASEVSGSSLMYSPMSRSRRRSLSSASAAVASAELFTVLRPAQETRRTICATT